MDLRVTRGGIKRITTQDASWHSRECCAWAWRSSWVQLLRAPEWFATQISKLPHSPRPRTASSWCCRRAFRLPWNLCPHRSQPSIAARSYMWVRATTAPIWTSGGVAALWCWPIFTAPVNLPTHTERLTGTHRDGRKNRLTAPSLIQSPWTNSGMPMAATRMSALLWHSSARGGGNQCVYVNSPR